MKRTRIFTLVMAIFWTLIAIAAVVLAMHAELTWPTRFLMVVFAFVASVGNWMRWYRRR